MNLTETVFNFAANSDFNNITVLTCFSELIWLTVTAQEHVTLT